MTKQYTREQYWQLFNKLPEQLKNLILAEETANDIFDACERNDVEVDLVPKVAKYTGNVLMGTLAPDDLPQTLETEVGLESKQAKALALEIHRHIFYPVRGMLSDLYRIDLGPVLVKPEAKAPARASQTKPVSRAPRKPDVYRETIK